MDADPPELTVVSGISTVKVVELTSTTNLSVTVTSEPSGVPGFVVISSPEKLFAILGRGS